MTTSEISVGEEMITRVMRYCDGELEPSEAEAVAKAIADDPELQALARDFLESSHLARETMDAIGNQPVPMKLARAISQGAQRPRTPFRAILESRIAAAIIGVAVGAGALGIWSASRGPADEGLRLAGANATAPASNPLANSEFKSALLSLLSAGEEAHTLNVTLNNQDDGKLTLSVVDWFKLTSGASCAEFSLSGGGEGNSSGVACRRGDGGWEVMTIKPTAQ